MCAHPLASVPARLASVGPEKGPVTYTCRGLNTLAGKLPGRHQSEIPCILYAPGSFSATTLRLWRLCTLRRSPPVRRGALWTQPDPVETPALSSTSELPLPFRRFDAPTFLVRGSSGYTGRETGERGRHEPEVECLRGVSGAVSPLSVQCSRSPKVRSSRAGIVRVISECVYDDFSGSV